MAIHNIEFELNFNEKEYFIEAEAEYFAENYGEDADGNRGKRREYCELIDFEVFEIIANETSKEALEILPDGIETEILTYCANNGENINN